MIKNLLLGFIAPAVLLAVSIGVFISMRTLEPPKVQPPGTDLASRLAVLPAAEVRQVRSLSEVSETLDIEANGTVVPYREIQIAAEVAGKIVEKNPEVRSGTLVKKGQLLFRIDPRDYELEIQRLTQLKDQEYAAQRELEQDVSNAQRMLKLSDEEMQIAEAEVKRFEALPNNFTSQTEFDAARRSRLAAANQRTTVQNQMQSLQTRRSRLELAEKLVGTQLEQAKLNLSRCEVTAPVSGRIVRDQAESDSYVARGSSLIIIEDTEKIEVACNIRMDQLYWIFDQPAKSTEQLVSTAQAGLFQLPPTPVTISYTLTGRESTHIEWQGALDRVEGAGFDPQSRTVPCRILVEDPSKVLINGQPTSEKMRGGPPSLVRGMFVQVKLHAKPATTLLLVPKLGVKPGNIIWKYTPDASVLELNPASVTGSSEGTAKSDAVTTMPAEVAAADGTQDDGRMQALVPEEWDAGRLEFLKDAQVIGPYRVPASSDSDKKSEEYWICEVQQGALLAGQFVVVSPLPGVRGDGTDGIRVPMTELAKQ